MKSNLEFIDMTETYDSYRLAIIDELLKMGFDVYIKNHPHPTVNGRQLINWLEEATVKVFAQCTHAGVTDEACYPKKLAIYFFGIYKEKIAEAEFDKLANISFPSNLTRH